MVIQFTGHIGLAFIVLLVTTLCGMLGFVFAGFLFILSIAVFRSLEINELLPFSKKERKTRFLTEVMLDLLCLSVPLLINTAFIVIRHRKLELFSHPLYCGGMFYSIYHNSCTLFDKWYLLESGRRQQKFRKEFS